MKKKYELLKDDTIKIDNVKLYRIRALRNFDNIIVGDLGGYIEKESNLSHDDNCWVADDACIYGSARVYDNAYVSDNAHVFGNARVYDNARILDNANVYGNARVYDRAYAYKNACIYGNAIICHYANVFGDVHVFDSAVISHCANVYGNATICNNANITNEDDYIILKGLGSKNRTTTFFRLQNGYIGVKCGCFEGTLSEFKRKVKKTYSYRFGSIYRREYLASIKLVKIHFGI